MGSRTRGRPPTRWIDDVENDLKTLNIKSWHRVAAYRWNWKKRAVEAAKTCNRRKEADGSQQASLLSNSLQPRGDKCRGLLWPDAFTKGAYSPAVLNAASR
ncbi:hypothetical protein TNCV_2577881 [Trichonephila clavipes]|nr:hypothetical protein TNCV_2577881 [Trichonephila clavipes]